MVVLFKTNFIILNIKRFFLPFIFCAFTLALIVFSKENLNAAKTGIALWADSVLPALLPFFIATELLSYTGIISFFGKCLNRFMRPIFNVPGEGAFPFIMGIISGYPVGAKIVTKLRENNTCSKKESERLLAFTNNSGPLFIVGTVGISLIGDTTIGIILLIIHILASITVGVLFRFWKSSKSLSRNYSVSYNYLPSFSRGGSGSNSAYGSRSFSSSSSSSSRCSTCSSNSTSASRSSSTKNKRDVTFSNLGEILGKSIMNSINTVVMIGGFVVLFSVVISILENSKALEIASLLLYPILDLFHIPHDFATGILSGVIELTNGLKTISTIPIKEYTNTIILSAFLLGFGGISILLQVYSIISKTDISIKPYIIGKILHAIFSAIYIFTFFRLFVAFSINL